MLVFLRFHPKCRYTNLWIFLFYVHLYCILVRMISLMRFHNQGKVFNSVHCNKVNKGVLNVFGILKVVPQLQLTSASQYVPTLVTNNSGTCVLGTTHAFNTKEMPALNIYNLLLLHKNYLCIFNLERTKSAPKWVNTPCSPHTEALKPLIQAST
jgi:hypothetical protein